MSRLVVLQHVEREGAGLFLKIAEERGLNIFICRLYKKETLPEIFQKIAYVLPLVYIFEEARNILINQTVNIENVYYAFMWNAFYFSVSIALFYYSFNAAKNKGTLINMGEYWCARKESNPEPPEPKSGALSS